MTTIPLRLTQGDVFVEEYFGGDEHVYTVLEVDENEVKLFSNDVHGTVWVDEHEITDMANGADAFKVYRHDPTMEVMSYEDAD